MKLTTLFLIVSLFQVQANSYGQNTKLTLDFNDASVSQIFNEIETVSEFRFLYESDQIDLQRKTSLKVNKEDIFNILDLLFENTNIDYKINGRQVILTPKKVQKVILEKDIQKKELDNLASVLQHIVSGTIHDDLGQPLPGASIVEKGTTNGTQSDFDGNFSIQLANENAILVVSYMGFATQEIPLNGQSNIAISLTEDAAGLDEVVVVGYGQRTKRDVTSAISSVGAETIENSTNMGFQNAMQGTLSGVQVSGTNGNPMSRPTVRIRGTNTWGVSDPLYVIDGIPITEIGAGIDGQEDARLADIRGPVNIMNLINPSDIESISVLKDATAAAIYGVRAANGVILITTKKGQKGKPIVEFSTRLGIERITQRLDWLSTPEYTKFVNQIFDTNPDQQPNEENNGVFDENDSRYLGNSPTYNWGKAVRNNAVIKDYNVKVSGGTDNMDYYVSFGYSDNEGTILTNQMDRYSGAAKLNAKINNWIKTGFNLRLVSSEGQSVPSENYFDLIRSAPWQPIYEAIGIPGYNGYAYASGGPQPDGSYAARKLYGNGTRINHVGRVNTNDESYHLDRTMWDIYLELTPLPGLKLRGTVSHDKYSNERRSFEDYDAVPFYYTAGDPRNRGGVASVGSYGIRQVTNTNKIEEVMLNYTRSFEKHDLDFLFNFSNQHYGGTYLGASTDYLTTKKPYLRKLGGDREYSSTDSDNRRSALQGYLFRLGYNYSSTYYIDMTLRRDGSARFAPENRWGTFPAVSFAWRVKNLDFLIEKDWMNDLKLRAGWGQLGNQEVRDMAYLSTISTKPTYAFGNNSSPSRPAIGNVKEGATIFGIPNRNLEWERTETYNLGFDAELFGRFSLSAEYYYKKTSGILQTVSVPPSLGTIEAPIANIAKVQNQGIEISANWRNNIGEFNYNIGANFTTTANKVLETYQHIPMGTIEEGYSMFYHKAYKVDGIFQTDQEAEEWKANNTDVNWTNSKVGAGDFYFKDLRGAPTEEGQFYSEGADRKIDAFDQVYVGKSIPGYFYGLNLGADYKGIDFNILFSGVGDVIKYNSIKAGNFAPTEGSNVTSIVYNAWTPNNMQNTYPRLVFGDPAANLRNSDFYYESGAYFRLQNVQVGYTLPKVFYNALMDEINFARIYISASNLFTITPYTGLDPEDDEYPAPRGFFMGLNVRF